MKKILRSFLEIKSLNKLRAVNKPIKNLSVEQIKSKDFQLNKFLYKQIGKKYFWIDRLSWDDKEWIEYASNKNLYAYVLKIDSELAGFFELIFHPDKRETEIAYFGIFEEYFGKKFGGYLLSEAIKIGFQNNPKRVWVHTCSLDHQYALKNYISRGMSVFKSEVFTN